jgi:hypothetical protein
MSLSVMSQVQLSYYGKLFLVLIYFFSSLLLEMASTI